MGAYITLIVNIINNNNKNNNNADDDDDDDEIKSKMSELNLSAETDFSSSNLTNQITPTESFSSNDSNNIINYSGNSIDISVTDVSDAYSVTSTPIKAIDESITAVSCQKKEFYKITNKTIIHIIPTQQPIFGMECQQILTNKIKFHTNCLQLKDLAGLESLITEIQELLEFPIENSQLSFHLNIGLPHGILIHGGPGVGKSTLLKAFAIHYENMYDVMHINSVDIVTTDIPGEESKLKKLLSTAVKKNSCLLLIDDIDNLAPSDFTPANQLAAATNISLFATFLDNTFSLARNCRVVVIATTRQRENVSIILRRPGRLSKEIEITAPDNKCRLQILKNILEKVQTQTNQSDLTELASKAHGFVAADLKLLVTEACLAMRRRLMKGDLNSGVYAITHQDLAESLRKVRPSAMRDILLEVPKVRWCDIGGMEDVKQILIETVQWPLQHPEAFIRLGTHPPKGILLYGPPGCSKTMIARALATESGLNFLAVKGPEIFSKWVGDSEKAIRNIFSKAMAAAPSIIFFDEIDALAVTREGQGSHVSDRVLTQLLTEMDGLVRLEGVTIVAATNRPDVLDKALLRPGRMDKLIYIPPPGNQTRREIFNIKSKEMPFTGIDLELLVHITKGFSGAELVSVCHESAMIALHESIYTEKIEMRHLKLAIERVTPQITDDVIKFYTEFNNKNYSLK